MKHIKTLTVIAVLMAVIGLAACPSQQTMASIWHQAGVLADVFIATYAPAWAAANKANFDAAWAKAESDITNWKKGEPCANVVQAVNAAAAIFATVPVLTQQQQLLVAAIVASIDVVTANFANCTPNALTAGQVIRWQPGVQIRADQLPPPKSAGDVKKLWKDAGGQ